MSSTMLEAEAPPIAATVQETAQTCDPESPFQNWRALAIDKTNVERHICLGNSFRQVKEGYAKAFLTLLTPGERNSTQRIVLQRWKGTETSGRWESRSLLPVPASQVAALPEPVPMKAN